MTPIIGRIVHYQGPNEVYAAIISFVEVLDGKAYGVVSLHVFEIGCVRFLASVAYDEECVHGTWHWPPRV